MRLNELATYCKSIDANCINCEHESECDKLLSDVEILSPYGLVNFIKREYFDVDAVVEKLEENTVIGADCIGNGFECIPKFMAISIVKEGGKDE